ncbi:MAG: DgaE family pyridoxal phosphate-dependent ammonia lyase [Firmicutes bacterium]|nr:DgaE family pyridoxal phosphate-dependent ammonia lyase [Bacillota bacterium]
MNVYEKMGLQRVVNASGRMTYLGVSTLPDEVAAAAIEGGQNYVVVAELIDKVGELISAHTGAEDSCVTCSASAGIAIAVAGLVTKGKRSALTALPDSTGLPNRVILQKGHSVDYGAPISIAIRLGGGIPVEVGTANLVLPEEIEEAIDGNTACLFYCKSHHCVQKGMVSLEEMIDIAHRNGLPILVDAAAEEDMRKYVAMGADLVVYSGAKALEATTSGFITGRKELISWCKKQYQGIGRAMKVGKEQMVGLVAALDRYDSIDHEAQAAGNLKTVEWLNERINAIPGCRAVTVQDEAGRKIYRSKVTFDPACGMSALEVDAKMREGNPSVHCRPNLLSLGAMLFDVRPLVPGDKELIVEKLRKVMEG